MPLFTDGTTQATEAQIRAGLHSLTQDEVDAWIAANAPILQAVVDLGQITVSAETESAIGSDFVRISFNIDGTTGDRKRLLKMAADALDRWFGGVEVDDYTYRLEKGKAKDWAQWIEAVL